MGKAGGVAGSMEVQQTVRVGKLNLVDLAGSERVHVTGMCAWEYKSRSCSEGGGGGVGARGPFLPVSGRSRS